MIVAGVLAALGAGALALVALTPGPVPGPPAAPNGSPKASTPTHGIGAGVVGARFARAGDCLTNDGTETEPLLHLVTCGPGSYTVLARFEGVTDADAACAKVAGYEYNYSYDSPLGTELDFVLCLKSASS
jgi:hypothetical protein